MWARDTADGQVKGFLVETGQPGYQATTMTGKGAARAIWQADIGSHDVRGEHLPALAARSRTPAACWSRPAAPAPGARSATPSPSYDAALTYAKQREQFGQPLVSFQLVQDRLVKMLADVTGMQLYCMQLARLEEAGRMTDTIAGLAKLNNTRTARRVIAEARDLLGGNGVLLENHVIRHMTDIEVIHTYEGTETMQALIVGRDITGVGAFK